VKVDQEGIRNRRVEEVKKGQDGKLQSDISRLFWGSACSKEPRIKLLRFRRVNWKKKQKSLREERQTR